jgi:tetratricopeptide (TPR) repeat protein
MPHPKRFALTAVFVIFLLPFSLPAWGQGGGGGSGSGGGGGTGGSTGGTGAVAPQPESQPRRPSTPEAQGAPVVISGRVVIEQGTPPPDRAAIEWVCSGKVRREGYTDSRGYFSVSLGQSAAMLPDASFGSYDTLMRPVNNTGTDQPNSLAPINLVGCEIRAALPGFHSDTVPLAGRRSLDPPDIGVIVLHPIGRTEGTVVSATSLRAPKSAKKALKKGLDYAKKSKWAEAQEELLKAVQTYPDYSEAWFELGLVYRRQGQTEQARTAFQKAVATDSRFIRPYFELAQMAAAANQWQEAADFTDKALALNAYEYPIAYFINSVAYYNLRNLDQAQKSALQVQRLDSQHRLPQVDLLLSDILVQRRDYQGAADRLRNFLTVAPNAPQAELAKTKLERLEQVLVTTRTSAEPEPQK